MRFSYKRFLQCRLFEVKLLKCPMTRSMRSRLIFHAKKPISPFLQFLFFQTTISSPPQLPPQLIPPIVSTSFVCICLKIIKFDKVYKKCLLLVIKFFHNLLYLLSFTNNLYKFVSYCIFLYCIMHFQTPLKAQTLGWWDWL